MAASKERITEFEAKVASYKRPEQLFGELPQNTMVERLENLKKEYAKLLYQYHPESNEGESEEFLEVAGRITNRIIYLYALAEKKVMQGTYGLPDPGSGDLPFFEPFETKSHRYVISRILARGDNSRIYAARMDGAEHDNACLKVANDAAASQRLLVEKEVLENVLYYQVPKLLDAFITGDGLMVLAEELIDGFDLYSLLEMPQFQKGIPQEHVAWIADRGLNVIGKFHDLGRLHGNITPAHLMIRPADHSLFLIGHTEGVKQGARYEFKADIYGAPEISRKAPLDPKSDIYAFGKCIILALGGDPVTNELPESVDLKIVDFLAKLVCEDPENREGDAWGAWHRWSDLRLELFGARRSFKYFEVD